MGVGKKQYEEARLDALAEHVLWVFRIGLSREPVR